MADFNLDDADLSAADFNGLVRETVLEEIFQIDVIPLPMQQMAGTDSSGNSYAEWTEESLQAIDYDNAAVDGDNTWDDDDTAIGRRRGNHMQALTKVVPVSSRARAAGTIGYADAYARQILQRGREIRRDLDGISLLNQASVADDGSAIPGRLAGLPSWLTSNTDRGVGGADGGFAAGLVAAATEGEARGITETAVRDMAQAIWEGGGDPSQLVSVPGVLRQLSEYMFTNSARIATLQKDVPGMAPGTAVGTVNIFVTDFNVTLMFLPNRLQTTYDSADVGPIQVADVFLIDPQYVDFVWMRPWATEALAKRGLSDTAMISGDVTLRVFEEAHGVIADIDPTVEATL